MLRKTSSGNVITVDFTGVESGGGGFVIPAGEYLVRCKLAKVTDSKSAGNQMVVWTLEGLEGKALNRRFMHYTVTDPPEARWKLKEAIEAFGLEAEGEMKIELDDFVGLECMAIVETDTYEGKDRSKVTSLQPKPEEEEEALKTIGKPAAKKPKLSIEEVRAMDDDELTEVIEKHDLEVDLAKLKTQRNKALAVIGALQDAGLLAVKG